MATLHIEINIFLEDYFSKFGFGDGDGTGAVDAGYEYRSTAITILNRLFAQTNWDLKANEIEYNSCHNNCRLVICKGDREIYYDEGCIESVVEEGIKKEKFLSLMAEASLLFDAAVEGCPRTNESTEDPHETEES